MRRFMIGKAFLLSLFPLFAAAGAWAVSPDPKLLSLVPPEAQIVAGMQAPVGGDQPASFLLITRNNNLDLEDFFALSGADSTRVMRQVIFLAAGDTGGTLTEHSLLVSGHFDEAKIFRSAKDGGALSLKYRGIRVLEVQPLRTPCSNRCRCSINEKKHRRMRGLVLVQFETAPIPNRAVS
jgi:hypothetical protein